MTSITNELICLKCKHFREFEGGCKAFPNGIPNEIIFENNHSKPLPKQGNNIVFEGIKEKHKNINYGLN